MEYLKRRFSVKSGSEDIMADEESDEVRRTARASLNTVTGSGKKIVGASSMKELIHNNTMLLLSDFSDAWKTAGPVTEITDKPYPFDKSQHRPNEKDLDNVYKIALGIVLNPVNKEYRNELEGYTMQMFGESREKHEAMKAAVMHDQTPKDFKLRLDLLNGKDLIPQDANGNFIKFLEAKLTFIRLSDPYCFITVIKAENLEKITSSKHNLEEISKSNKLELAIRKSNVISKSLNPTWNQAFELPLRVNFKTDMIVVEVWDSDKDRVHLKEVGLTRIAKYFYDDSDDDFMGRGFLPLSDVTFTKQQKALTLYSRHRNKEYGEVRIQVSLTGDKPAVATDTVMKDHSRLTATVLDFESHLTGEYIIGWNAKVTPLGYKLISLNATMNGLSQLQQVAVLFPLLQCYDERINLSIIAYFGIIKTISSYQKELSSFSDSRSGALAQTIFKCLNNLDATLIGVLRKHRQFFSFQTEAEIEYLGMHVDLVKEMYTIASYVERLDSSRKSLKDTIHNACVTACEDWFDTLVAKAIPLSPDKKQHLLGFVEVITFVIQWLHNSTGAVQNIFKRVGVDYYMLLYSTVDKQIAAAVRHHTSDYGKGDIPSYQLYLHLGDILKLSVNISSEYKQQLQLKDYHNWFTDLVSGWIDAAAQKCNIEIKRAITALDNVVTVTENVKYSHSALSAAACFKRMAAFWNNLQWPKIAERYAFITAVVNSISKSAGYYVQESHKHLKSKRFYDNPNTEEFEITHPLCICLNDIEYVREELSKMPVALKFDAIILRLSEVQGDEQAVISRRTLTSMIEGANDDVVHCFNEILESMGEQMSSNIMTYVKTLVNADPEVSLYQALDPLMQYLSKGMQTFNASLSKPVLNVVLEKIWIITFSCFNEVVQDPKLEQVIAKRISLSLKELESFFYADGNGLPLEKIKNDEYLIFGDTLDVKASTDDELIESHLRTLAKWTQTADKKDGLLSFSVGYIQDKQILEVTVIKGTNLPAMDSNGKSDPYVEILLMPQERFNIKPVKTDYKSKELNPFYAKEFEINVKEELLNMSGSSLSLTVLDYDRFTKNDYCGMVVIGCEEIPRLPDGFSGIDNASAPQRKTYELPLIVDTATPALFELSRRNHHYVQDFNRWHSRRMSVFENIASKISPSLS